MYTLPSQDGTATQKMHESRRYGHSKNALNGNRKGGKTSELQLLTAVRMSPRWSLHATQVGSLWNKKTEVSVTSLEK